MDYLLKALQHAWEEACVAEMVEVLVEIAEGHIQQADKARAAEILALVIHYPMQSETRRYAEAMFSDLDAELCPRTIWDAREKALTITLDDMVTEILAEAAE
jgi:thymidylate synthase ThyX